MQKQKKKLKLLKKSLKKVEDGKIFGDFETERLKKWQEEKQRKEEEANRNQKRRLRRRRRRAARVTPKRLVGNTDFGWIHRTIIRERTLQPQLQVRCRYGRSYVQSYAIATAMK